jgi:cyclomaltodextrinase
VEAGNHLPARLHLTNERGAIVAAVDLSWSLRAGNRDLIRFRGTVPTTAAFASFEGYEGIWRLPSPITENRPAWLTGAVLYSILVDRWHRGSCSAPDPRAVPRDRDSAPEVIYGGDLYGLIESLSWIADLGVDAVLLTPICLAESPHRYDAADFQTVDPRLGGERALAELASSCHSHGLRLVLDAAFTHCHYTHKAFQDLLRDQAGSVYRDWFLVEGCPVSMADPESYRHYPGHPELLLLDLGSPPVIRHLETCVESWMRLEIDGLRFDCVEYGPPETWRALGACARKIDPEVALIAECVFETPAWAVETLDVHCATDYGRHELLVRALETGPDLPEEFRIAEELLRHRLGPGLDQAALQFIETHDTDRFLTRSLDRKRLQAALEHLLLGREPVLFYYGTEFAITSGKRSGNLDASWPDRLPMPALDRRAPFVEWTRRLLRRRRSNRHGDIPIAAGRT